MQQLHSHGTPVGVSEILIGRITSQPVAEHHLRNDYIIDGRSSRWPEFFADPCGYSGVLLPTGPESITIPAHLAVLHSVSQLDYVSDGDVVAIYPSGRASVLYRRNSNHNSIL